MTKPDKFDNSHPYLWLIIFCYCLYWVMAWLG